MRNFIQPGNYITATATGPVAAGQGVLMGALFGVATTAATTGDSFEIATTGVYSLPKAAGAITAGQLIYWDATEGEAPTASESGANKLIGAAIEAAGSAAATVNVRLNGTAG